MADSDKILSLLIKIGVVGKEDVKAANDLLGDTSKASDTAATATKDLGKKEAEASEHAEKLHISHQGLHKLFNVLGRETVPEFGHALGAALYGPVGYALALGAAVGMIRHGFEQAEKAAEDFTAAVESGSDVASVTKAAGEFEDALSRSATGAAAFQRAMDGIIVTQRDIKTETDTAVTSLNAEANAIAAIAKSKLDAEKADVRAEYASGKIDKEDEIRRLTDLENAAAADKVKRDSERRAKEIALRAEELKKTQAAAALAAAAVPAAQEADLVAAESVERRAKMVESLKAQIAAAKDRDKKIIDEIGPIGFSDNSKTDFTSKIPGASSDEANRYRVGKATVESDASLIANFEAMLKKLDTPESKVKFDKEADATSAAKAAAEKNANDLAQRAADLEKELDQKKRENFLLTSTDAQVNKNETRARNTDSQAEIDAERQRIIKEAADDVEKTKRVSENYKGPDHASDAIKQIKENNNIAIQLGNAARAAAVEHSAMLQEILQAYNEVLAANAALREQLKNSRNRTGG